MRFLDDLLGQSPLGGSIGQMSEQSELSRLQNQQAAAMQQTLSSLIYRSPPNIETRNPEGTLALIKKSIKEIKAEAVSEEAQSRVRAKIDRLLDLGILAQAAILNTELRLRAKLARVQEWDYKVLPYEAIEEYVKANKNWDGIGGQYKVHINSLETYRGTISETEAKDKIIPDNVLDELEQAKDRQVFDKFSVLWVEKVPDPLLLGSVDGCKDFFLITEWGTDISFDELTKNICA